MRLGLWVLCEGENQTLETPQKMTMMLDFASDLGVTDIFLQVYRRNHAWFPVRKDLADESPYRLIYEQSKIDPVAFVIAEGKKRGISVHAWFNIFWIGENDRVPILRKYGKGIVTRDQKGRYISDYPEGKIPSPEGPIFSLGEGGYWLEPGDDRVQRHLFEIIQEFLNRYPDISGIHLDYFRYPYTSPFLYGSYHTFNRGVEYGYGIRSLERFKKETGLNPMAMERTHQNHLSWDNWRRQQLTDFLDSLKRLVLDKNHKIQISCAAVCYPERSHFAAYQDWMGWLRRGSLDFVATMTYTLDSDLAENISLMAIGLAKRASVWIGLAAYLFEEDGTGFRNEFEHVASLSPSGIALFSYDGLIKQKNVVQELKKSLRRTQD